MTPFGARVRELRRERNVTQKQMAQELGVSAAWLSALEKGRRGRPSWAFLQRVIAYFNIIWDEADELADLARISHPRIVVDTSGLSPQATEFANYLAGHIEEIDDQTLAEMMHRAKLAVTGRRSGARTVRKNAARTNSG